MRELLYRLRIPLLLAALVLFTGVTMLVDPRPQPGRSPTGSSWSSAVLELVTPLQKTLELPVDFVRESFASYLALVDLRQQNERLEGRISELEEENLQFREALVASGRLERIAAMREDFEVPMRPSEVVGQDVSPWFRSVLLDRGRSHGVRSGMPVVTDRGVVGLITATTGHAARSMLLLDRQSAVDGIVQRSRARGIVRGTGTQQLELVFVVRGDDVQVGDVVITSGVGGVYPKGLRLGQVMSVDVDENHLLHSARLEPAVDFGRLEQVFVMLRRGPNMELLYSGEGDVPRVAAVPPEGP
jgi:rod shape-determining protein MreC